MTAATIFISAWIAALVWPYILASAFKPNVDRRLNAGSNLDDALRLFGALVTGYVLIAVVSVGLLLVIA